jgi:hypothetical protein
MVLYRKQAHPNHIGWASWPKGLSPPTKSRNRNKDLKIKQGLILNLMKNMNDIRIILEKVDSI